MLLQMLEEIQELRSENLQLKGDLTNQTDHAVVLQGRLKNVKEKY